MKSTAFPRATEPQESCPAFTLVELLVVIAIVAILASTAVPMLTRSKAAAQRTICANNLHQLGIAASLYNLDAGRLPSMLEWLYSRPVDVDAPDLTSGQMHSYLRSRTAYVCPTEKPQRKSASKHELPPKDHSYVMNCMMCHVRDLSACLTPAKTLFFLEQTNLTTDTSGGLILKPDSVATRPAFHHNLRGNVMMIDTHVESLKEGQYRAAAVTREFWHPTGKP